jgi:hypothetical protein
MIAADWYGVHPDTAVSPRVLRLGPILDQLDEPEAALVELMAHRLATGGFGAAERETGTKLWHEYTAAEPIAQPRAV